VLKNTVLVLMDARFLDCCCPPASQSVSRSPPFTATLSAGELGDGLGALGHGVLGQLAGQHQAHRGLNLAAGHGRLLVVARQTGGLRADLVEDVVHEGVKDGDGLGADAGVGVHLLQHLVDVQLVALHLGGLLLLLAVGPGLGGGGLLGGSLLCCLGCHGLELGVSG